MIKGKKVAAKLPANNADWTLSTSGARLPHTAASGLAPGSRRGRVMLRPSIAGHARKAQQILAHPASRQLMRYIIAGLFVTWLSTSAYFALAWHHVDPYLANVGGAVVGLSAGYFIHSRWSFREGGNKGEALQIGRFLLSAGIGFSINSFWIWLTVKQLGLSPLFATPLMMGATPLLSFLLNRYWVFRAH